MEPKRNSTPAILGIIGGVIVVIGSFLSWATVSLNVDAFAKAMSDALGVPVNASDIASAGVETSQSISGLDADGKITLVAGIVVVIGAVLLLAVQNAKTAGGVLVLLGGLAGAGVALYDIVSKDRQIDDALAEAGPQLSALGLDADTFKQVFTIEWSIGIYACILGGVIALVAGIMALMAKKPAPAMPVASGAPPGGGFGSPMGSPMDAPPPSAPPPSTPSPMPPDATPEAPPSDEGSSGSPPTTP